MYSTLCNFTKKCAQNFGAQFTFSRAFVCQALFFFHFIKNFFAKPVFPYWPIMQKEKGKKAIKLKLVNDSCEYVEYCSPRFTTTDAITLYLLSIIVITAFFNILQKRRTFSISRNIFF